MVFIAFLARVLGWNRLECTYCFWGQHLLILLSKRKNLTTPTFAGVKSFGRCLSLGPEEHNSVWVICLLGGSMFWLSTIAFWSLMSHSTSWALLDLFFFASVSKYDSCVVFLVGFYLRMSADSIISCCWVWLRCWGLHWCLGLSESLHSLNHVVTTLWVWISDSSVSLKFSSLALQLTRERECSLFFM